MDTPKENPYAPPTVKSTAISPLALAARLSCPVCHLQTFPYWKVYCVGHMWPFRCPQCSTKLKAAKIGLGRWTTYFLAIPCALIGAVVLITPRDPDFRSLLGGFDKYLTLSTFVVALVATFAVDFFIDKYYVYLRDCRDVQH